MNYPITPEEFLSSYFDQADDGEAEAPPESPALPQEVVENERTGPFLLAPGAFKRRPEDEWTIQDPTPMTQQNLSGYIEQIAADLRAIREHTTGQVSELEVQEYVPPLSATTDLSIPSFERVSIIGDPEDDLPVDRKLTRADLDLAHLSEQYQLQIERGADAEAKLYALTELVEAISAVVKPSSSKVSNEVKRLIEGWANPQVDEDQRPDPEASQLNPDVEPAPDGGGYSLATGEGVLRPGAVLPAGNITPTVDFVPVGEIPLMQPEHTAHVEAWRAYAREVQPEVDWKGLNRSQIRTALGIQQPVEAASEPVTIADGLATGAMPWSYLCQQGQHDRCLTGCGCSCHGVSA